MKKVWECIRDNFGDTKDMTKEEIKDKMYMHKMMPCEIEAKYEILTKDSSEEFEDIMNCNFYCENCLDRYLETEVKQNNGQN
jgi:hypothetical protein